MANTPTIRLPLRILREPVASEAPQPPERVRLDDVLALLHYDSEGGLHLIW